MRALALALTLTSSLTLPLPALACGLSPHIGPTGLIEECDGQTEIGPWRLSAQGGVMRSELEGSGMRLDIEQGSATARVEYRLGTRFSIGAGAGSTFGGSLSAPSGKLADLNEGFTVGGSAAALVLLEQSSLPFVLASLSAAYSVTQSRIIASGERAHFIGRDVRLGLAVGKTFAPLRPYLAARVFTGGFRWQLSPTPLKGGDRHKYQLGAGLSLQLSRRVDALLELMPLGEQSLTAGLGISL